MPIVTEPKPSDKFEKMRDIHFSCQAYCRKKFSPYSKPGMAIIERRRQSVIHGGRNMGMPAISSDWKPSFVMAMRELNPVRLKFLVTDAERAVFTRYRELGDSPHHHDERVQMSNALEDLQAVRLSLLA
jgi:hypothetical protein